jgi:ribonuclease R
LIKILLKYMFIIEEKVKTWRWGYWSFETKTDFVGVIDIQKNFSFVSTANPKCIPIFYSKDKIGEAEQGDVVLVHIEDWPARADSPLESDKVLGKPGEHDTNSCYFSWIRFTIWFPIEVKPAQKIDTSITESEIANRRYARYLILLIQKMQRFWWCLSFKKIRKW